MPANTNPIASASDPPGKNNERGARRLARIVGAVIVTVALPELATEAGEIAHVVPGKEVGTLQPSETVPVNPFRALIVRVVSPPFPLVPAVRVMAEVLRTG